MRAQVRIDHDERLDLEGRRDLEDGPQGRALAADPVDLRVRQADPLELVAGPDEQDLLDVVGRFGLDDDAARAVGRAGVRVDDDRDEVREVLDEPSLGRAHHVADGRRVLEAGDADHDVGVAEAGDLVPYGRRQGRLGHRQHRTTPDARGVCPVAWDAPSAAGHRGRGPIGGLLAGPIARVRGLECEAAEALGSPRPDPGRDRRADVRAAAGRACRRGGSTRAAACARAAGRRAATRRRARARPRPRG